MVNGETPQQRRRRLRQAQLKRSQKRVRRGTMNINQIFNPRT